MIHKFQEGGIITDHDKVWDYKKIDGKWHTKKKSNTSDNWIDISDNEVATDALDYFLEEKKYYFTKDNKGEGNKKYGLIPDRSETPKEVEEPIKTEKEEDTKEKEVEVTVDNKPDSTESEPINDYSDFEVLGTPSEIKGKDLSQFEEYGEDYKGFKLGKFGNTGTDMIKVPKEIANSLNIPDIIPFREFNKYKTIIDKSFNKQSYLDKILSGFSLLSPTLGFKNGGTLNKTNMNYFQQGGEMMPQEQSMEQPAPEAQGADVMQQAVQILAQAVQANDGNMALQGAAMLLEAIGAAQGGGGAEQGPPAFKRGGKIKKAMNGRAMQEATNKSGKVYMKGGKMYKK